MIYTITLNPSIDYIVEVSHFQEGILNRTSNEYFNVGGKGIMVSKLLHTIGVENTALGFLGGFTGDYIKKWFIEKGYPQNFTPVTQNTRINIKLKGQTETEVNAQGPFIQDIDQAHFLSQLDDLCPQDVVILSGSSIPGADQDIFTQIIQKCKLASADFVIDTGGKALKEAFPFSPLLIKPNQDEISELFEVSFQQKEDILPYGKKCLEAGAKYAIVSLGSQGAYFFAPDGSYYAPAVEGTLVNSVGAGDSMIAGFVGRYRNGYSALESFRYAVACGSATAFSKDIGKLKEIERILDKVMIQPLTTTL